jgi:hypothetical protein
MNKGAAAYDITMTRGKKTVFSQKAGISPMFKRLDNLVQALRKAVPFNRLIVSDKDVAHVPFIHVIADKKNVLISNPNFIVFNDENKPVNIKENLPCSVTVTNDRNTFRNMAILRQGPLFAFSYDPANNLFYFSEMERCHEVIGECSVTLFKKGVTPYRPSPIQVKAALKVDGNGKITTVDLTLFNLAGSLLSEKEIAGIYARFAESLSQLGCGDDAKVYDYTHSPNMPFMAGYLKARHVKTLGDLKERFGKA